MATTTDYENVRAAIIFAFADALRTVREHEAREDSDDGEAINAALGIAKGLGWDWEKDADFLSWCLKATEQEICVEGMLRALRHEAELATAEADRRASFTKTGAFDVSSPAKRAAAMEQALRSIAIIPQAYNSQGAEVVVAEMQRSAVETLHALAEPALAPAPVKVERCVSCDRPAHPSETDDDGRCERCSGTPRPEVCTHCGVHFCTHCDVHFEDCDCPPCEAGCCGVGCQACGWTGRLLCEHCGRARVGRRDECGGIGEGICAERAAAEPASSPLPSTALAACFFCHQRWGSCTCRWSPRTEDDGFEFGDMIITHPNVSECGRFFVNPETYYGDAYKSWAAKR